MDDKPKTCGTCAFKSDGINTKIPDYCYVIDAPVTRNAPACDEYRSSLRTEPLAGPDVSLVQRVGELDKGEGED